MIIHFAMSPWFERDQPTPFDAIPMAGKRNLDGDQMAAKYRQEWVTGKQYPIIHFPSNVEREITVGRGEEQTPHIHVFNSLELPYQHTRDEAFTAAVSVAREQGYLLGKEHDNRLRIANPHTGRSYVITFDNQARHMNNIELFPEYAMDLMPGEVRAAMPPLYSNEKQGLEAIAPVKFFTPMGSWTWYATEFDGQDLCFGLVSGFEVELGYFSVSELESVRGAFGLPIERDEYFEPKSLRELQDWHLKNR